MTFEELLGLKVEDLENISDLELLVILAPCLERCPPIDVQILNKEQEVLARKKQELKDTKKAEKLALKEQAKASKPQTTPTSKPKSIQNELQRMMELIAEKQQALCNTKL